MFVGAGYGGVLALGIACSSDAIIDANVAILVLPAILAIALVVLVLIRAAVAVLAHRLAGGGEAIILGGRAILTDPATRALVALLKRAQVAIKRTPLVVRNEGCEGVIHVREIDVRRRLLLLELCRHQLLISKLYII